MYVAAWMLDEQDDQRLWRELEVIEREVEIANHQMKLEVLQNKIDGLDKETDVTALRGLIS